jgi:hypothetical protein
MAKGKLTRRKALKLAAASTALPLVHIRTGRAAGKLTFAVWDHWVPQANPVLQKLCDAWAAKNQVEFKVDYITGVSMKINLVMAAESQAKTGHDLYAFDTGGRCDEKSHRTVRPGHAGCRIPGQGQRQVDGRSRGLGFRAADALRAYLHVQEVRR